MIIEVAAAVIYKEEKILIAKRAQHKDQPGYWEFPGGKIEPGETPEQCLIRELEEELKIKVEVTRYLAENTHDYGTVTILLKAYACTFLDGEFRLSDHDEIQWVIPSQLKDYRLAPADVPLVGYL